MALFLPNNSVSTYGYGGVGYSAYGASPLEAPIVPVDGGYGGEAYGTGSYGSIETTPPKVSSAKALDGYRVEVFFNEDMVDDTNYYDITNYTITEVLGAPVVITSIFRGTKGNTGYSSVIVIHQGTTMGGTYTIQVQNLKDTSDNEIISDVSSARATFLALEPPTTVTGTVVPNSSTGNGLIWLQFTSGIGQGGLTISNYSLETTYPIQATITDIQRPSNAASDTMLFFETEGMTKTDYALRVGPSPAILFDNTTPEPSYTKTGTGEVHYTSTGFLISKEENDALSLYFADENSPQKILPNSSFTASFEIDLSTPTIRPYLLTQPVAEVFISDGVVEVSLIFKQVNGVDVIEIISDDGVTPNSLNAQVLSAWRSQPQNITLVRNELYGFYSLMVNGACLVSIDKTKVTGANVHGVGVTLSLNSYYRILLLPFRSLDFTASQTVYTTHGNFIHNSVLNLTGNSNNIQEILKTKHGPLTKGWGDGTPASDKDVKVRVNGVEVEVEAVNPYIGAIKPKIPIPLIPISKGSTPPYSVVGNISVDVDYKWLKNPIMPFAGLNTEGLTLNKWDRANHLEGSASVGSIKDIGVPSLGRFPFGVVLPMMSARPSPKQISHRYIGFERDYSAVLNSPTTMTLNQDPNRVAIPDIEEKITGEVVSFDGNSNASVDWKVQGSVIETVVGDGTFRTSGNGMLYREVDYTFPKATVLSARFQLENYDLFGVFTGAGFGLKTTNHVYFLGLLEINSVKHIGFLTNLDAPNELDSWELGMQHEVELSSQTTFSIPTKEYPTISSTATVRLQVISGTQKGVYTVTEAINQSDGNTTVTVTPAFPASWVEFDNSPIVFYFEHLFQEFNQTYRMVVNTEDQAVEIYIGGAVSGLALSTTCKTKATRTEDYFDFKEGVFWGTLGDQNLNTILWSLFQYGTTPKWATRHSRGIVTAEHFYALPEAWFVEGDYGRSEIQTDTLYLRGDGQYEYAKIEPFLKKHTLSDIDFTFRVSEGDAQVVIEDQERKILFQNILYTESALGEKSILVLNEELLNGKYLPQAVGWSESSEITKFNAQYHLAESNISPPANPPCDFSPPKFSTTKQFQNSLNLGLSFEFRVNQKSYDGSLDDFQVRVAQKDYVIIFDFNATGFTLSSPTAIVHTETFDHLNAFHTYKFVVDVEAVAVVVLVDDEVKSTLNLAPFAYSTTTNYINISTEQYCVLDFITLKLKAPSTAKRTLGVLRGTDLTNINDWEIPRTDAFNIPNSYALSEIVEMDWRQKMDVRLHRDSSWGLTLYRPDLPPPTYFNGNVNDWATYTTNPSGGWINIEYDDLPKASDTMGKVSFGIVGVGSSYWNLFRYRVFLTAFEDFSSPHHMVLNQHNVLTSDERHNDITLEVAEVESLSNKLVSLIPTNLFGNSVYTVVIEGKVAPSSSWSFDTETQTIFFNNPVLFDSHGVPYFDSISSTGLSVKEHYVAKITFSPSNVRTKTYLDTQEMSSSVTLLNEGTPPVPKSQIADAIREVVFGSGINIHQDTLNIDPDFYLNDPSKSIQFRDPSDALYENLEFIEKSNTGKEPIEIACDDFNAIGISGTLTLEQGVIPPQGAQQVGHIFHASGGNYTGQTLGGENLVLYPNAPASQSYQGSGGSAQRQCHIHLETTSVLRGSTEVPLEEDLNYGGETKELFVCQMLDYANLYSHIGPWGGSMALAQNSLLYGASSAQPSGIPASGQGFTPLGNSQQQVQNGTGVPLPKPAVTWEIVFTGIP